MRILAIDTSSAQGSLAVLEGLQVLATLKWEPGEDYSVRLIRDAVRLLEQNKLTLKEIELLAVVSGPGTFTGLRVGLTAVKGWAEACGTPIAAISALEALASQAKSSSRVVAPVLDARRGQIFGGVYERTKGKVRPCADDVLMTAEEFLDWLASNGFKSDLTFISPSPEVLRGPLAATEFRDVPMEVNPWLLAPAAGVCALQHASEGRLYDALTLDAHYVRRSDAEVAWKES